MKITLKWSKLNDPQKDQIKSFFSGDNHVDKHDLNRRIYTINPYTGNIVFYKGF